MLFLHSQCFVHLDIKPTNFLVDSDGRIKLADFDMTKKYDINLYSDDIEGDCVYISKEALSSKSLKDIKNKSDLFSLGLSYIELIFKIELPKSGPLWMKLREGQFIIDDEIIRNANFNVTINMIHIITALINPVADNRPNADEIIMKIPELSVRYSNLLAGKYIRTVNPRFFSFYQKKSYSFSPIK